MKIIEKSVEELTPYENNPRKNDGAVDAVAASIREFGFKVPIIIDRDGVIVAGHTRLKAAKKLGMETVPCIIADDLSPKQIQAFRLADNKTAELADWDFDMLSVELSDLDDIDMSEFGFDMSEFEEPAEAAEAVKNIGQLMTSRIDGRYIAVMIVICGQDLKQHPKKSCENFSIKSVWCTSKNIKSGNIGQTSICRNIMRSLRLMEIIGIPCLMLKKKTQGKINT